MSTLGKALLTLLFLTAIGSAALYWHGLELDKAAARQQAEHQAITKKVNDEWRPKMIAMENSAYERSLQRAKDELASNDTPANHVTAQLLYETKRARLKQEHEQAIKDILAKYP